MDSLEQLRLTLKLDGASLTQPRQAVFDTLRKSDPLTMAELVAKVGNKSDRASVYRTAQLFEKLGVIQRLQIGWKYKLELSDSFSPHHHHLTCLTCNKIITIDEDKTLERKIKLLGKKHDFTATDHQLEIRGVCADCQTKNLRN